MKFQHLPIGARFEFQGKVYCKTDLLLACADEGGGQRIIPRWAAVRPVGDGPFPPPPPTLPDSLERERVLAGFEHYHAACQALLNQVASTPERLAETQAELERIKAEMLAGLAEGAA